MTCMVWSVSSGSDVVDWLFHHVEGFSDRREARKYASNLLKAGYIRHTVNKITFSEQCYYIFGDLCGSKWTQMFDSHLVRFSSRGNVLFRLWTRSHHQLPLLFPPRHDPPVSPWPWWFQWGCLRSGHTPPSATPRGSSLAYGSALPVPYSTPIWPATAIPRRTNSWKCRKPAQRWVHRKYYIYVVKHVSQYLWILGFFVSSACLKHLSAHSVVVTSRKQKYWWVRAIWVDVNLYKLWLNRS